MIFTKNCWNCVVVGCSAASFQFSWCGPHGSNIEIVKFLAQRKCDQYWPDGGLKTYGQIEVTAAEVLHMSHYTLRNFILTHKQVRRFVFLFRMECVGVRSKTLD